MLKGLSAYPRILGTVPAEVEVSAYTLEPVNQVVLLTNANNWKRTQVTIFTR